MTPWWLRPTAESEKKTDEPKDEPAAPAKNKDSREGGAPEEARRSKGSGRDPERGSDPGSDRASGKTSDGKSSDGKSSDGKSSDGKTSDGKTSDKPAGDDKSRRPGKDGRRRPSRSRRSDDSKGDDNAKKTTGRSSSKRSKKEEPSDAPKETSKEKPAKQEASKKDAPKKERQGRERKPDRGPAPHDITAEDIAEISRELFSTPGGDGDSVPERNISVNDERKIAMFCDLENIALGVRDSDIKKFDITLVLERLLEKGKIIVKRAYCDWERYSEYKRAFHEAAIEMLDIPQKYYSGKNSADIKMVVDALDLCYTKEHLDTFVLLSGDSDFSPLVSKLKENDKYVIGIGVKNSSSALLVDNCDEFIFYEDIWRDRQAAPELAGLNKKAAEAFSLMIDAIQALIRENKEVLWGSMIKQTMQRKRPSFNEGYFGYGSFSELLEDAEKKNILKLKKDKRSGTYIVTGFAQH